MANDGITLDKSLLWPDIQDIVNQKDSKIKPTTVVSCILHCKDYDLTDKDNVYVTKLNIISDYVNHISDYIEIEIKMLYGAYVEHVYPYLANFEVTLIRDVHQQTDDSVQRTTQRYKAVYLQDRNHQIPNVSTANFHDLNQLGFVNITLQLLDLTAEALRIKTVYGSFDPTITESGKDKRQNTKPKTIPIDSFIRCIISQEANNVLIHGNPSLDAIEIQKVDNVEPIERYVIPSGTKLLDLPIFLQKKSMGIYNDGCGAYIDTFNDKKTYFVYSLYSATKYKDSRYKTVIYIPMTSNYSNVRNTYLYQDKVLKIVALSNNKLSDKRDSEVMSEGIGFRATNAKSYMKKPVEITEKGPRFKRTGLVTEIIHEDRKDNLNYANVSLTGTVTYNLFEKTSEVLKNVGNYITVIWHNSNPLYIYPGMPVKINSEDNNGKLLEHMAVIHQIQTVYTSMDATAGSTSIVSKREFDVTSSLLVFVTNDAIDKT
jgi:hypothetical protein